MRLNPAELIVSVRALLLKETERVDDPHFIPEDRAAWHALNPIAASAPHYEPESWRWLDLVDVRYVDEMALVVFTGQILQHSNCDRARACLVTCSSRASGSFEAWRVRACCRMRIGLGSSR